MGFSKSKAKMMNEQGKVTFNDVAGVRKEEESKLWEF